MRYKGIHYDTGVRFTPARLSRTAFDEELVCYEIATIGGELHANAVRMTGEDLGRLEFTAKTAVEHGLSVFLQPWPIDRHAEPTLDLLTDAAELCEELRRKGADITLVVGQEASLFTSGFVPGASVYERIDWMLSLRHGSVVEPTLESVSQDLNAFLASAAAVVRRSFGGAVTYAAGTWEDIEWSTFDVVGLDYYRQSQTDDEYKQGLRAARQHGKPVVVTEIGCCAYEGADLAGGTGFDLLDEWAEPGPRWKSGTPPIRSEATQADYLTRQLSVFMAEQVEGVFVFTLSAPYLYHDPDDPARDFDMTSFSLTKLFDARTPRGRQTPPWQPKEAFYAVGKAYARLDE